MKQTPTTTSVPKLPFDFWLMGLHYDFIVLRIGAVQRPIMEV